MQEVDDIFHELIRKIGYTHGNISGFCGSIHNKHGTCIKRCTEIVNLMLYMKGYEHKGTQGLQRRPVNSGTWQQFQEYLRCTVTMEALLRLYGRNGDHITVMDEVSKELEQGKTFVKQRLESGICENRDWAKVLFQSKSMGTALQNRLNSLRERWTPAKVPARSTSGKCGWDDTEGTDNAGQPNRDEDCNAQARAIPQHDELMKAIKGVVDEGHTFPNVHKVLQDMQKPGQSQDICRLEQKIKEGVQHVQKQAEGRHEATLGATEPHTPPQTPAVHDSGATFNVAKPARDTPVAPGATATPPAPAATTHMRGNSTPSLSRASSGYDGSCPTSVEHIIVEPCADVRGGGHDGSGSGSGSEAPDEGRGTATTTSPGSGGRTTRSAATGVGPVNKGDTQAAKDFLVKVLVSYIKDRGIPGNDRDRTFNDTFWADMKTVYDEFVTYMDNTDQEALYGTLCHAAAQNPHQEHMLQSDLVVCEFMLGALLFKHGLNASRAGSSAQGTVEPVTPTQRYMKCMIVNVFIHSMLGQDCLDTTGAGYAEKAIYELLKPESGFHENATCDGVDFSNTTVAGGNLRHKIREWIKQEKIKWGDTEAAGILSSRCKQWRQEGQRQSGIAKTHVNHIDNDEEKKIQDEVKHIKGEVTAAMDKVHKSIDIDKEEIQSTAAAKVAATKPATPPPQQPPIFRSFLLCSFLFSSYAKFYPVSVFQIVTGKRKRK
ncbi:hypothetical protein AK88_01855 [Plasmodium fragile]|uniref:Schizont-infected cell agglutination extracellular alpha domain-containing protein n=1 Tax=Plasmodium fragile TaxID=5857 RepID=A0A0D9QN98_PLAFR|nr:uncharacterized protein AK88_01855 [Plasmodium fragile]KJP88403.1 hypothetical protein AK88_01855 [Plasmodium fragile]